MTQPFSIDLIVFHVTPGGCLELSGVYWEISGEYYVTKYPDPDVTRECKIFSNREIRLKKLGIPESFCGLGR